MKYSMFLVSMLLFISLGAGCVQTPSVTQNATLIQTASMVGGYEACKQLKDPAAVAVLRTELTTGVLPLLNATTPLQAQAAETAIFTPLVKNLGPDYKLYLTAGLTVLGGYYMPATADTVLNADQLTYLKAFANGLVQGIDIYQQSLPTTTAPVGTLKLTTKRLPPYFFNPATIPAKAPQIKATTPTLVPAPVTIRK